MSGIFRPPFRTPAPVQGALGALTAGASGGEIRPAAFVNASTSFAPTLRTTLKPGAHANAPSFAGIVIRCTLKPIAVASDATPYAPSVAVAGAPLQPAHHANGQSFFAPVLRATVKSVALGSGAALHAPRTVRGVATSVLASGAVLHGPRLAFRVSAASYANVSVLRATVVALAGVKLAPLLSPVAQVFAPQVSVSGVAGFAGGAIGAGWGDAPPRRRRAAVPTWPNLPKTSVAPPWRLTVVTPEVARAQARVRLAWRKRIEQEQRKRAVDGRVAAIFDALVDQEIARTIATLNAEV